MGLAIWQIQVQKKGTISNVGNLRGGSCCISYSLWKTDINGLISDSWLVREWAIERERKVDSLLMHAFTPITHIFLHYSSFSIFLSFSCSFFFLFLPFSSPFFPPILPCMSMAFYTAYCDRICHFYPLTTFGLLWVSFQDYPLVCWLPNHHYTVLVVPRYIFRQKWFCFVFYSS